MPKIPPKIGVVQYTAEPDNTSEILSLIGRQPPCPTCGNRGEYETEFGPRGCQACNSRCIAFIDREGKRVYADWGDFIVKDESGLRLVTHQNSLTYRTGTPYERGVYACRIPMILNALGERGEPVEIDLATGSGRLFCEDRFLMWDGSRWGHVGSDQYYRGRVVGWLGPLPRLNA